MSLLICFRLKRFYIGVNDLFNGMRLGGKLIFHENMLRTLKCADQKIPRIFFALRDHKREKSNFIRIEKIFQFINF